MKFFPLLFLIASFLFPYSRAQSAASLAITDPHSGAVLPPGKPVAVSAVAVDPNGYISRVEFYADATQIGVSELFFLVPPPNGTPINHSITWTNPVPGAHILSAVAKDAQGHRVESPGIHVTVGDAPPSGRTVVRVTASDPEATEMPPFVTVIDPAQFVVTRDGPTNNPLRVFFSLHGTATPGVDYHLDANSVLIAAGETSASIEIVPVSDLLTVVEPMETVGLQLEFSPLANALSDYDIDPEQRQAAAVIFERARPGDGAVELAFPDNGENVPEHTPLSIVAAAYHPSVTLGRVEFYSDDQKIGVSETKVLSIVPGGLYFHGMTWKEPVPGKHIITARATLPNGTQLISSKIQVSVAGTVPELPVVSVRYLEPQTEQPTPNADYAPGSIEFRRTGPTNQNLRVFFDVDGSATPGVDYEKIDHSIIIAAGHDTAYLRVIAIDDSIVEGNETVLITLTLPLDATASLYRIDSQNKQAAIIIYDNDAASGPAHIDITAPAPGSNFPDGANINIHAVAIDPKGYIPTVEFHANDKLIGVSRIVFFRAPDPGTPIEHSIIWTNAPAGEWALTATGVDASGNKIVSRPVTINVGLSTTASVAIVAPKDGSVFSPAEVVTVRAEATGRPRDLAIFADGKAFGHSVSNVMTVLWTNPPAGPHTLTARITTGAGEIESRAVRILVQAKTSDSFVTRDLPSGYSPGAVFIVHLAAHPAPGTRAWTVEDIPPRGWAVSEISNDGVFDVVTGKVKFGPFTDAEPRALKYNARPPENATGRAEFSGSAAANGVAYPIAGDRVIEGANRIHPADADSNDQITQTELTAYAAAWKSATNWPAGPSPIPASYVTRGAMIWQHGEKYHYESQREAPECWVPDSLATVFALNSSEAVRTVTAANPGSQVAIGVFVTPAASVSGWTLEESVPEGWSFVRADQDGSYDPQTRTIRWGVFYDAAPRELHYSIIAPSGITSVTELRGSGSFDGADIPVSGASRLVAIERSAPLKLPALERDSAGAFHLHLQGPSGQPCVLEVSADLESWTPLANLFLPDGQLDWQDAGATNGGPRFYRLRVP